MVSCVPQNVDAGRMPFTEPALAPSCRFPGVANPNKPVRFRAGCVVLRQDPAGGVTQVLLISRRNKGGYSVPAGKMECVADGGSFEACAMRETREEAGVEGELILDLGWYHGQAKKDEAETSTRFFMMRFGQELSSWDEASQRTRAWFGLSEAERLVDHNPCLVEVLRNAVRAVSLGLPNVDVHGLRKLEGFDI